MQVICFKLQYTEKNSFVIKLFRCLLIVLQTILTQFYFTVFWSYLNFFCLLKRRSLNSLVDMRSSIWHTCLLCSYVSENIIVLKQWFDYYKNCRGWLSVLLRKNNLFNPIVIQMHLILSSVLCQTASSFVVFVEPNLGFYTDGIFWMFLILIKNSHILIRANNFPTCI